MVQRMKRIFKSLVSTHFLVCMFFLEQEISLTWSEVINLIPKRDELLETEKGRQKRILY